jgi:hypothetical protein
MLDGMKRVWLFVSQHPVHVSQKEIPAVRINGRQKATIIHRLTSFFQGLPLKKV